MLAVGDGRRCAPSRRAAWAAPRAPEPAVREARQRPLSLRERRCTSAPARPTCFTLPPRPPPPSPSGTRLPARPKCTLERFIITHAKSSISNRPGACHPSLACSPTTWNRSRRGGRGRRRPAPGGAARGPFLHGARCCGAAAPPAGARSVVGEGRVGQGWGGAHAAAAYPPVRPSADDLGGRVRDRRAPSARRGRRRWRRRREQPAPARARGAHAAARRPGLALPHRRALAHLFVRRGRGRERVGARGRKARSATTLASPASATPAPPSSAPAISDSSTSVAADDPAPDPPPPPVEGRRRLGGGLLLGDLLAEHPRGRRAPPVLDAVVTRDRGSTWRSRPTASPASCAAAGSSGPRRASSPPSSAWGRGYCTDARGTASPVRPGIIVAIRAHCFPPYRETSSDNWSSSVCDHGPFTCSTESTPQSPQALVRGAPLDGRGRQAPHRGVGVTVGTGPSRTDVPRLRPLVERRRASSSCVRGGARSTRENSQ